MVHVNGKVMEIAGMSIWNLLLELDLNPALVVVEVNQSIIKKEAFKTCHVMDGDRVELVQFVGGG